MTDILIEDWGNSVEDLYISTGAVQVTISRENYITFRVTHNGEHVNMVYTPNLQGHKALWDDIYSLERNGGLYMTSNKQELFIRFGEATQTIAERLRILGAEVPLW